MTMESRLVVCSSGTLSSTPKSGILLSSAGASPIHTHTALCFSMTGLHPRSRRNVFGAVRVTHAGAAAVVFQAVIRALDAVAADDLAHAQRRKAMRAAVLDRGHAAIGLAIEHDRLVHDGARHQLPIANAVGPCRHIPRIAQIAPADHLLVRLCAVGFCMLRHVFVLSSRCRAGWHPPQWSLPPPPRRLNATRERLRRKPWPKPLRSPRWHPASSRPNRCRGSRPRPATR